MKVSRGQILFTILAVLVAFVTTRSLAAQPGYTDAYYHFNAAEQLVRGDGLTDAYLWTYVGDPDSLPVPSHLYWMPFTSLAAAFGMWLLDAPGDYAAAQWPFALMLAGAASVAYWLGGRLGGGRRHAWAAGLITLFSGFYTRFWGQTDTFAPYALAGALCLLFIGLAVQREQYRGQLWYAAGAGVLAGIGHLTRADGVLLLLVGWLALLWPFERGDWRRRLLAAGIMTIGYLVVMAPWFIRNLDQMGAPLPVGGMSAMWYGDYNDLFLYGTQATPDRLFADGVGTFLESRWTALINNLGTFVAVEGLVIMAPLMLIGLYAYRRDPFVRAFWLYALGLHLAMTFVFPFPGYRGGLFHSAAALVPWWAALALVGLDRSVEWMARRRRNWKPRTAAPVFTAALVLLACVLSWNFGWQGRVRASTPALHRELAAFLPEDARVMINDPAQLYYFTGRGGVVTPNASPDVIPEIARRYGITHLLIEVTTSGDRQGLSIPRALAFNLDDPPEFLSEVPFLGSNVRLYAIDTR